MNNGNVGRSVAKKESSKSDLECVWVKAGLIASKVCDLDFDCEHCPLDTALREGFHQPRERAEDRTPEEIKGPMTEVGRTEIRDKILETFFHQLQQFSLRDDRYYFAPHTWVQKLNEDSAVVGIDDFAARMLPPPTSIVFPSVNAPIQQGEYCAWLVSSEGTIAFISPATGVIHAVNDELYRAPGLLLTSPYDKGWLVRVGLEKFETDMRNLLPRISASGRCRKDIERLRRQFLVHSKPDSAALGKTLLDGGRYVENVQVLLGLRRYIEIISQILSS